MDRNVSCPAVSQTWTLYIFLLISIFFAANSTPTVDLNSSKKMSSNFNYLLKYVIIGAASAGKTYILLRNSHYEFKEKFIPTIVNAFYTKISN